MNRARENNLGSSEMLDGVRQGEPSAITQFVVYYYKSIQTVVRQVITAPDIAREVTDDTLKAVVKQLQLGVHTGDFESWILWMARNNAMMYARLDRAAVPSEPVSTRYVSAPPEPAPAPSPLLGDTPEASAFEPQKQLTDVPEPPKESSTQNRGLHVVPQRQNFSYLDMLIIILMVLIIIFLLWVLTGLLAKLNIFTIPDLGYNWFNSHLFRLF